MADPARSRHPGIRVGGPAAGGAVPAGRDPDRATRDRARLSHRLRLARIVPSPRRPSPGPRPGRGRLAGRRVCPGLPLDAGGRGGRYHGGDDGCGIPRVLPGPRGRADRLRHSAPYLSTGLYVHGHARSAIQRRGPANPGGDEAGDGPVDCQRARRRVSVGGVIRLRPRCRTR